MGAPANRAPHKHIPRVQSESSVPKTKTRRDPKTSPGFNLEDGNAGPQTGSSDEPELLCPYKIVKINTVNAKFVVCSTYSFIVQEENF
jgi:hypothetical protein